MSVWDAENTIPIYRDVPDHAQSWVETSGFSKSPGTFTLLPGNDQDLKGVLFIPGDHFWDVATLSQKLPAGVYRFADHFSTPEEAFLACFAWGCGTYQFDYYKSKKTPATKAILVPPSTVDKDLLEEMIKAVFLVRDLINTPANDMGPPELIEAARLLATHHGAAFKTIEGEDLLAAGYPAIYTVGKGAEKAPALIDMTWGNPEHPKIVLVGKGVCFDSGGLNIKDDKSMLLMKKDMGGAAHVLGLASLIMALDLPLNLRVLIGAVENSVDARSMRPLDVTPTRKGLTVEIGHTDAEGRVVLADCLAEAVSWDPQLIVDFATLTGAARVALGPEVPAFFTNDDLLADKLMKTSLDQKDPLWRLPLWSGYKNYNKGKTADLTNSPQSSFGGAITAALFLQEFVDQKPWIHVDLMAWNPTSSPGRPEGGEAMTLRSLFSLLQQWGQEK